MNPMNRAEFDRWFDEHADLFSSVRFWKDEMMKKNPDAFARTMRAWADLLHEVPVSVAEQGSRNMLANEEHHPRRVEQHPGRILRYHQEHAGSRGWKSQASTDEPRCGWCGDTGRVVVPAFGAAYARAVSVYGKAAAGRVEVIAGCWCDLGRDVGIPRAPREARPAESGGGVVPMAEVKAALKFIMGYLGGSVSREEYGKRFPLPALATEPADPYADEPILF
jgi:hypothetical protein